MAELITGILALVVGLIIGYHWKKSGHSWQYHFIIQKLNLMATKLEELEALVTDLQTSVDAKQETIAAAITGFEATIADLQSHLGTGATDEQ